MKFSKGHAIWIYDKCPRLVQSIKEFNARSQIPIQFLFVYSGTIGNEFNLQFNLIYYYSTHLPQLKIVPLIDGDTETIERLNLNSQENLAWRLAMQINQFELISGLHLNIEPFNNVSLDFCKRLKKEMRKHVSICVYEWHEGLHEAADILILMGYDYAVTPGKYRDRANLEFHEFVRLAQKNNSDFMIGLPFVATHHEFETKIHRKSGKQIKSGFKNLRLFIRRI